MTTESYDHAWPTVRLSLSTTVELVAASVHYRELACNLGQWSREKELSFCSQMDQIAIAFNERCEAQQKQIREDQAAEKEA